MSILDQVIQNHFKTSSYTLTKLDKGISNHNYLLTIDQNQYVVRCPRPDHDRLHLQFEKEKKILPYVQDLDVHTVLFDTDYGIKITDYVPHVLEFHETSDPKKYQKTAVLLRTLHEKSATVDFFFDPFYKLSHYKEAIHSPFVFFAQESQVLQAIQKMYQPCTLCHNDVVQGNLLFSSCREYLIDWEYSAMNDFRFDIASFFSENQITDSQCRNQFYVSYGHNISDQEIRLFEALADILWGYWANMLYDERQESIYKEIAQEKERHYHTFSLPALPL